MILDERHVQDYRRQGFACVPGFLSSDRLAAFRREVDRITAASAAAGFDPARVEMEPGQGAPGPVIRRIYEPCEHYAPFREFSVSQLTREVLHGSVTDGMPSTVPGHSL